MNAEKLKQIVAEKNDTRERQAIRTAEEFIEAIVSEQRKIAQAEASIAALRNDLKALEVELLDPNAVLGE